MPEEVWVLQGKLKAKTYVQTDKPSPVFTDDVDKALGFDTKEEAEAHLATIRPSRKDLRALRAVAVTR